LIALSLVVMIFSGCPVMEKPAGLEISGKIYMAGAVTAQNYNAVSVNAYTPHGDFIDKALLRDDGAYLSWEMELFVAEGTLVIFWVELQIAYDDGLYFASGQEDVVTSGNEYDWTVNAIKVPIFTEADLRKIGLDASYSGDRDFVLVGDIGLTRAWEPLCHPGNTMAPFSGSFDGNGHTISGLYFEDGGDQFIGLFASTKGTSKPAVIKNMKIVLSQTALNLIGNEQKVGFAVAEAAYTDIDRISVTGPGIIITKGGGNALSVGAIAATLAGESNITRCGSSVPLTITSPSPLVLSAGGLVGKLDHVTMPYTITIGNIYRSYSSAAISVNFDALGAAYAGGIAGGVSSDSSLWFEECYASGNISINGADRLGAGGIAGGVYATHTGALFFSRSVAMMREINVVISGSGTSCRWGMISGDNEYITTPIPSSANAAPLPMRYYASDISYLGSPSPAPSATTAGTAILRSNLTSLRFFQPLLSNGMNWDANQTWKWDAAKDRPVFQWE
jgi:hypothetical protein